MARSETHSVYIQMVGTYKKACIHYSIRHDSSGIFGVDIQLED